MQGINNNFWVDLSAEIQRVYPSEESQRGWGDLARKGWARLFFTKWFAWGE